MMQHATNGPGDRRRISWRRSDWIKFTFEGSSAISALCALDQVRTTTIRVPSTEAQPGDNIPVPDAKGALIWIRRWSSNQCGVAMKTQCHESLVALCIQFLPRSFGHIGDRSREHGL